MLWIRWQLSLHFTDARRLLDEMSSNGLSQWARKVRAIPNGKALIPAALNEMTWQIISSSPAGAETGRCRVLIPCVQNRKALHPSSPRARKPTQRDVFVGDSERL